jgi:hypothetical protein
MSPIPGIVASQISGHLASPTSYESIATYTGTGSNNSVTFSSIASTWKHLQIRAIVRCTTSTGGNSLLWWRFNGDSSTASYAMHGLYADGSSAGAYQIVSGNYGKGLIGSTALATSLSNTYTAVTVDILDYGNTSKNKTVRSYRGEDYNGSGEFRLASGVWLSTSAITSIEVGYLDNAGSYLATNTQIALYGIKG